jgi:replicative DNA helicase
MDGKPIDYVSVTQDTGLPGHEIAELADAVPSSANVRHYAELVHNAGTKRNTVTALRETLESVERMDTAEDIIDSVESRIMELHDDVGGEYRHVREYLKPAIEIFEQNVMAHKEGRTVGIATGITRYDEMTGGLRNGEMIIVGARASIGKTAFGLTVAGNISVTSQIPVAFMSLEMSGASVTARLFSMYGNVDSQKLWTGKIEAKDFADLHMAGQMLHDSKLYVYDVPNARLSDIKAKARRLVMREGCKTIVVDYIGLINSGERFNRRHEEIAYISRQLKQLARELDVPVVVLAQLNRQAEGKVPSLAELAESGSIEQDADVVIFLHRDRDSEEVETDLIIAKHRNGPTGRMSVAYVKRYTKFANYAGGEV